MDHTNNLIMVNHMQGKRNIELKSVKMNSVTRISLLAL